MGVIQSLSPSDRLDIDGTLYRTAGSLQAREAGVSWTAWLLVEHGSTPGFRLRANEYRWLEEDANDAGWLWRPVRTPAGATLLSESLAHAGRTYSAPKRGQYRIEAITGEPGSGAEVGTVIDYLELHDGDRVLLLEAQGNGITASIGRRVLAPVLARWVTDARRHAAMRQASVTPRAQRAEREGADSDRRSMGFMAMAAAAVTLLAASLDSCDEDCRQRYDSVTGQYVEDCDGIRARGGRGFREWGGK